MSLCASVTSGVSSLSSMHETDPGIAFNAISEAIDDALTDEGRDWRSC